MALGPAPKSRGFAKPNNEWQLNRRAKLRQLVMMAAEVESAAITPPSNGILEEDGITSMTEEDGTTVVTDE